jgi:imidazolonepropionase-like amidohydrolase
MRYARCQGGGVVVKRTVVRALCIVLFGVACAALYLAATPLPRTNTTFQTPRWIAPVTIVDVETGSTLDRQALEIQEGRIHRILPASRVPQDGRAVIFNAADAYVVPGLWDMHALLTRYAPSIDHPLYLAHGVTRVRNILDCPAEGRINLHPCHADKSAWNAQVSRGELVGPVIMGSGSYPVAGPTQRHRDTPKDFGAATPAEAKGLVRLLAARQGPSDHIKTYDGLSRTSFFALMEEARRAGTEVSGHVPSAVSLQEAAAAGFKAIAHARVLPIACSSREAEIMRLRTANAPPTQWMNIALGSYDPSKCRGLWATLREYGTFLSPTLITRLNETNEGVAELAGDPVTAAVTPALVRFIWNEDLSAIRSRTRDQEHVYRRYYDAAAARTAEAAHAGVNLLLGSDTHDAYVAPGIGLHHEMELWRRAGIPARTILRAATLDAARYFGQQGRFGEVASGSTADLVFGGRNPLHDLSALRDPLAVMQQGRLYDRAALHGARRRAEEAARSLRYTIHFLRDLMRNPLGFAS